MYTVFDVGDRISARLHTSGSEGGSQLSEKNIRKIDSREMASQRV